MIEKAQSDYAYAISELHSETINQGFLTRLGIKFLNTLYIFLIKKELVLVYKENDQVLGFVSCAISSKEIMKRFLFSSPSGILKIVQALLKNPKLLKPLWETFRAPSLSKKDISSTKELPKTELLSICVSPMAQKGGIGAELLKELETELVKRNIFLYKVVAGDVLIGANNFYLKNGFSPASKITIHNNEISNVYIKKLN